MLLMSHVLESHETSTHHTTDEMLQLARTNTK